MPKQLGKLSDPWFNSLMDETTASNIVKEVQKQANSFGTAFIHSRKNVLWKTEAQTCQLGDRSDWRAT